MLLPTNLLQLRYLSTWQQASQLLAPNVSAAQISWSSCAGPSRTRNTTPLAKSSFDLMRATSPDVKVAVAAILVYKLRSVRCVFCQNRLVPSVYVNPSILRIELLLCGELAEVGNRFENPAIGSQLSQAARALDKALQ